MLLAQSPPSELNDIIGQITPVGPITGDPIQGLSTILVFGLRAFFLIVSLAVLAYMLWGAFEWVTSSGEKEKVSKAQQKMTYAALGLVITMLILALFGVIAGDILGIMIKGPDGSWIFRVPTL